MKAETDKEWGRRAAISESIKRFEEAGETIIGSKFDAINDGYCMAVNKAGTIVWVYLYTEKGVCKKAMCFQSAKRFAEELNAAVKKAESQPVE